MHAETSFTIVPNVVPTRASEEIENLLLSLLAGPTADDDPLVSGPVDERLRRHSRRPRLQ